MIKKISKKAIPILMVFFLLLNTTVPVFAAIDIGDTSHPSTNWLDAWTPENTDTEWPRMFLEENSISSPSRVYSSFWCMNSDYLRLKNINFSYTLPKSWTNRLGIANAKIYYTGENLLTFDSLPFNADPEAPSGNLDMYPVSRSHSFGLNITF